MLAVVATMEMRDKAMATATARVRATTRDAMIRTATATTIAADQDDSNGGQ